MNLNKKIYLLLALATVAHAKKDRTLSSNPLQTPPPSQTDYKTSKPITRALTVLLGIPEHHLSLTNFPRNAYPHLIDHLKKREEVQSLSEKLFYKLDGKTPQAEMPLLKIMIQEVFAEGTVKNTFPKFANTMDEYSNTNPKYPLLDYQDNLRFTPLGYSAQKMMVWGARRYLMSYQTPIGKEAPVEYSIGLGEHFYEIWKACRLIVDPHFNAAFNNPAAGKNARNLYNCLMFFLGISSREIIWGPFVYSRTIPKHMIDKKYLMLKSMASRNIAFTAQIACSWIDYQKNVLASKPNEWVHKVPTEIIRLATLHLPVAPYWYILEEDFYQLPLAQQQELYDAMRFDYENAFKFMMVTLPRLAFPHIKPYIQPQIDNYLKKKPVAP